MLRYRLRFSLYLSFNFAFVLFDDGLLADLHDGRRWPIKTEAAEIDDGDPSLFGDRATHFLVALLASLDLLFRAKHLLAGANCTTVALAGPMYSCRAISTTAASN